MSAESGTSSPSVSLSDSQKRKYNSCILLAKDSMSKQSYEEALRHYEQAQQLFPSAKLEAKISKLKNALKTEVSDNPSLTNPLRPVATDNKRACPHTPIKHEEKRRSPPISNTASISESKISEITEGKENSEPVAGDQEVKMETEESSVTPNDNLSLSDDVPTLLKKAKDAIADENVSLALRLYQRANTLEPSKKLQRRMERMQTYLSEQEAEQKAVPKQEEEEERKTSAAYEQKEKQETSGGQSEAGSEATPARASSPSTPAISMSDEDIAVYNSLLSQAKVELRAAAFPEVLSLYEQAYLLHPTDQLAKKISKLKAVTSEASCEGEDISNDNEADQSAIDAHYTELVTKGREMIEKQHPKEALSLYKDAHGVKPSDKLQRKINKIEEYLQQQSQSTAPSPQTKQTSVTTPGSGRAASSSSSSGQGSRDADMSKFNKLIRKAKQFISESRVKEALEAYKGAARIKPSEKLTRKIYKCQDYLDSNEEEESGEFAHVGNGFYLHEDLFSKLYPHQKESLLWFWGLHKKRTGGILADDMGLGKTIQIIAFLSGLFDAEEVKTVIIVMPLSLIENWRREFDKWAPGIQLLTYHGGSQRERARAVAKVQRRGGVLLTSYGMVVSSAELIAKKDGESFGREFKYDYVILDEGHKIKNPTKTSKGVHSIASVHRIILTGTPIQNNLKEMWALFDWTHHGMLLGTARTFHMEYNKPITRAREKCATFGERRLGEQMAESLKKIIAPYLLRRTKAEVKADARARGHQGVSVVGPEMPTLTRKNDFVVWCYLSEMQQKIYESFSSQDEIKELLNTSKSPLTALVVLKKICDHPRLLSNTQCHKLGLFTPQELLGADGALMKDCAANRIKSVDDQILIEESGKLKFLIQLMARLKKEGHRTLIFSLSRKMLDIVYKVLTNRGHKVMRMDGTITDLSEREKCVHSFQNSDIYDTFLLTTQVGGVGLTLTAADRVVIFDPSWNPATDSQAVDRAFRIGQQKNVCIYRLISCGTIEEKIYRRQIFKDSVNRQTMQKDDKNLFRYFSNLELYELFQLNNPRESRTQQQLDQMHAHQRVTDTALDEHIAYLYSCEMYGLSDHDLMFTKEDDEVEGDENVEYITERVSKAMELLSRESELQSKANEEEGKYIPGHLQALPKPSVKPPRDFDASKDLDPSSAERLFPEYDYGGRGQGDTGDGEDDVVELAASTPQRNPSAHRLSDRSDRDPEEVQSRERSPDFQDMDVSFADKSVDDVMHISANLSAMATTPNISVRTTSPNSSIKGTTSDAGSGEADFDVEDDFNLSDVEKDADEIPIVGEEEVIADDSIIEVEDEDGLEDSQSGSMLGDDFGHLHADYTVRDSGDDASFSVTHKRRSTFLAPPVLHDSDDEVDGGYVVDSDDGED